MISLMTKDQYFLPLLTLHSHSPKDVEYCFSAALAPEELEIGLALVQELPSIDLQKFV